MADKPIEQQAVRAMSTDAGVFVVVDVPSAFGPVPYSICCMMAAGIGAAAIAQRLDNAEHLAACWNYCIGLDAFELTHGGARQALTIVGNERRISDELNRCREQRDRLLAALKEVLAHTPEPHAGDARAILKRARAAIAAAEGRANG